MKTSFHNTLINIALGASWGLVLGGAYFNFSYFSYYGFIPSLFLGFLGALPGLFLIVILEFFLNFSKVKEESKKQTQLLEKILEKLSQN